MNIKENIRIAVFSIKTNLMRSLLTMLGIIIGVASVIAVITVGNGGRDYIVGMIRDMGNSGMALSINQNADKEDYFTNADIAAIKRLDGVEYVSMQQIAMCQMTANEQAGFFAGVGCNTDMQHILRTPCIYGRFFTQEEYEEGKYVGVIDVSSAVQLFGKKDVVGEYVHCTANDLDFSVKIIGVIDMASAMANMDSDEMMQNMTAMTGGAQLASCVMMVPAPVTATINGSTGNRFDMLQLTAADESMLDEIGNAAVNYIRSIHDNYEKDCYTVTNYATYIDLLDTVINVFTIFIAAVSAISLVVGGIGVMNIMLVSITERTREIGIRKALGAKTGTIMFQFLTESIILCMIGGLIGLLLGVSGAALVSYIMKVPLAVKGSTVLLAVGFSTAIGIIFGVYPARRAAKLPPIEALRRE